MHSSQAISLDKMATETPYPSMSIVSACLRQNCISSKRDEFSPVSAKQTLVGCAARKAGFLSPDSIYNLSST